MFGKPAHKGFQPQSSILPFTDNRTFVETPHTDAVTPINPHTDVTPINPHTDVTPTIETTATTTALTANTDDTNTTSSTPPSITTVCHPVG